MNVFRLRNAFGALLGAIALHGPVALAATVGDDIEHKIVAGDTLISIAQRWLDSADQWPLLQRVNGITSPRALQPGATIRIPASLLRGDSLPATVRSMTGQATLTLDGVSRPLLPGMPVPERAVIATGRQAFVTLELWDKSRISLASNTRVEITQMRRIRATDRVVTRLRVLGGRLETSVSPRAANQPFEISTPMYTAGVRGTRFRVGLDRAQGASLLEVLEGAVSGQGVADSQAQNVPGGFGVSADMSGRSAPMSALLPAPAMRPGSVLQPAIAVRAEFEPVPGATQYSFRLTHAGSPDSVVAEQTSSLPLAAFNDVPLGRYQIVASAIDGRGLQGADSVNVIERVTHFVEAQPVVPFNAAERSHLFSWIGTPSAEYRLVIARDPEFSSIVVELANTRVTAAAVTNLAPGTYYWRVHSTLHLEAMSPQRTSSAQKIVVK